MTGQDWHSVRCYGCGPENDSGLKADFRFDENTGEVRFEFVGRPEHLGAPGFVHGGVLASLLDEAQGVLCFHVGHTVMTDQLMMKYHKATPLGAVLKIRCWITAVRRRRLYTKATIHAENGDLLASARGVWYAMPERLVVRLFQDYPPSEREYVRTVLELNRKRAKEIRRRIRQEKSRTKTF